MTWHLLSLDAPTVAATWTSFIAWAAGVPLSVFDPLAMFLAVWMLYATDRLLDTRSLTTGCVVPGLEWRHHFHHAHHMAFVSLIASASFPLAWVLHHLADAELHLYVLLACFLAAWLILVHARPAASTTTAHRLPKEAAVGIFFPAAVFIPTVAHAPGLQTALLPAALAFAAVCTLNCLFLYAWEHSTNESLAHPSTLWGARHICVLAVFVLLVTGGLAMLKPLPWPALPHTSAVLGACGLSTALLLGLHLKRFALAKARLRALADLALLSPGVFFLAFLVRRHHG